MTVHYLQRKPMAEDIALRRVRSALRAQGGFGAYSPEADPSAPPPPPFSIAPGAGSDIDELDEFAGRAKEFGDMAKGLLKMAGVVLVFFVCAAALILWLLP